MLLFLFISGLLGTDGPPATKPPEDLKILQGTWILTSGVADGEEQSKNLISRGYRAVIEHDTINLGTEKRNRTSTFQLDPAARPKHMDLPPNFLGIYELVGDELKICLGTPTDRPRAFQSTHNSRYLYYTFKRRH